jgi:hypothetical protein
MQWSAVSTGYLDTFVNYVSQIKLDCRDEATELKFCLRTKE